MKVTPLEIRQQQFPLRFRGYDPQAVDTFLELVAGQVEDLMKENTRLREELTRKDQEIQQIREEEGDWKKALMVVQQTTEDMIARGKKQAQLVMAEAKRRAQQMLLAAEQQHNAIANDVQELTRRRHQIVLQLRSLLEQHLKLLEAQGEEGEEKRPEDSRSPLVDVSEALKGLGMLERAGRTMDDGMAKADLRRA
jgi:cell division initiation protein